MKKSEILAIIEAIKTMRDSVDDKLASVTACLYPTLKNDGGLIKAGTRINYNGAVKKARADLWDTIENDPTNAPNLWDTLEFKDDYRKIPETITAESAFALGEKGWWNDTLYESIIDNNVWTPDQYSAGWKQA